MNPKFPHVTVKLLGEDGNAFFILGAVMKAMRRAKVSEEDITKFREEATSGNYDHLLQTVMSYVNIE